MRPGRNARFSRKAVSMSENGWRVHLRQIHRGRSFDVFGKILNHTFTAVVAHCLQTYK